MKDIKVGQHIKPWVNHECVECGHEHFASRSNPVVVTENDLLCSDCLDVIKYAAIEDGLKEQLAIAKSEIADIRNQLALANLVISHCWVHEGYDMCGASKMTREEHDYFHSVINTRTEELLAKHKESK